MGMSMPPAELERLVYDLRPFWTADVGGVIASTIAGGGIDDPNALHLDGTRAMVGNLNMGAQNIINVNLVDGVDISVFAGRSIIAGVGLTGGGILGLGDVTITMGTPSSAGVGSTNTASGTTHNHAILHSSSPGVGAAILSTDSSGSITIGGIITIAGGARLNNGQQVSTNAFASGFLGTGMRIDQGIAYINQASAEFDNLIVRGLMRVYELVINKIRVSRGSMLVSPGGMKVTGVASLGGSSYQIVGDDDHGMTAGDLLRAQKFTITTGLSGVWQSLCTVVGIVDPKTVNVTHNSGDAPAIGFEYAVSGHTSDTTRQGLVYITADDSGAPFMDIVDGLASHALWGASSIVRTRVGKLTGITDPFFGLLTGYGIYASRGYFNGVRINGSLIIGPGVGFSTSALLYAPFGIAPGDNQVNTNGHLGQKATATASVVGMTGRFSGAVLLAGNVVNKVNNPSGETGVGFTVGNGSTFTQDNTEAYVGNYSFKLVGVTGDAWAMWTTNSVAAFTTYTVQARIKGISGHSVILKAFDGVSEINGTTHILTGGWDLVIATVVVGGSASALNVMIRVSAGQTVYVDAVQAENGAAASAYADGSMGAGHTWAGTAHGSISTRGVTSYLSYSYPGNVNTVTGSISFWAKMLGDTANAVLVSSDNASSFRLQLGGSALSVYTVSGTLIFSATSALQDRQWHHIVLTMDATVPRIRLYEDGVLIGSGSGSFANGTELRIGYLNSGSPLSPNALMSDFASIGRELTADDIFSIFRSNTHLTVTRSNFEIVLTESGAGRVVGNAGGIFGTTISGAPAFTLLTSSALVGPETLGAGDVMIGDNNTGKPNMLWDNSAGTLALRVGVGNILSFGASTGLVEGVLNLGTSGGIWQGSAGTFGSPTTGFRLRHDSATGRGAWETYVGGVAINYINPGNMGLYTVEGHIRFIAEGMYIDTSIGTTDDRAINFVDPSNHAVSFGQIFAYKSGATCSVTVRSLVYDNFFSPTAYLFGGVDHASGGIGRCTIYATGRINGGALDYFGAIQIVSNYGATNATITYTADNHNFIGTKSGFIIDHPLHPLTMELAHGPVESNEYMTLYSGTVILDDDGEAIVTMPDWFKPLNKEIRFSLTCVNDFAPVFVRQIESVGKFSDYSFAIVCGKPGMRVDWMVSGVRDDPEARHNTFKVERMKDDNLRGGLLHGRARGRETMTKLPKP